MQIESIEYLDGEFTVEENEPSTLEECIELIGEQGVVAETTSNLRYRNKYPRVYRLVSDAILPAFPKAQKVGKDGKPVVKVTAGKNGEAGTSTPVLVDATEHLRQFLAQGDEQRAKLAEHFNTIAPTQPLYVKGERTGGGGKISQAALDAANAKFAAGDEAVDAAIAVIESRVPGYKVARDAEGAATPEFLARGISALNKYLQQKAAQETKALLG
jgi:hypothetical protein